MKKHQVYILDNTLETDYTNVDADEIVLLVDNSGLIKFEPINVKSADFNSNIPGGILGMFGLDTENSNRPTIHNGTDWKGLGYESDLEDLQAEFKEQEVIIGGVYNNFQVEGNIIVCTNTDGKAVFTGFNISEDYKIIYLINNSNFEIQVNNESSSSLEENQIKLPNGVVNVGLQGTTVFAYITKGGLNKWQIIDVFGSRYMPEHKDLTEDAVVVVGEDSVSRSKQIVNLYDSDPSITSATLTDAELNIRVPGRVVGFELICENAGDNGIVYKLVNDTTGVWKKFILT